MTVSDVAALEWLLGTACPAWLRLAGMDEDADLLVAFEFVPDEVLWGVRYRADTARELVGVSISAAYGVVRRSGVWSASWAARREPAVRGLLMSDPWDVARRCGRDIARDAAGVASVVVDRLKVDRLVKELAVSWGRVGEPDG